LSSKSSPQSGWLSAVAGATLSLELFMMVTLGCVVESLKCLFIVDE
jgi:hypothetical protein